MKKTYFLLCCFTFAVSTVLMAQNSNWAWARAGNGIGSGSDEAQAVTVDLFGNVLIAGSFPGPGITFTSPAVSVTLMNSDTTGTQELFLAKYDASGNLLWARSAMGSGHDQGRSVTTDAAGNVYITGFFESPTLVFGTTTLTNASNPGLADIYVAKYDPMGNLVWVQRHGGALGEWGMSIAADASGNTYLTGFFHSLSVVFGAYGVISSGNGDAYVAKLDPNGAGLWAQQIGGSQSDMGVSISVDAASNVYVGGSFESSVLGFSPNITNAGGSDIFFVKYNSAGNALFSKGIGGPGEEGLWSITNDIAGNIYMVGTYTSSPLVIGSATLPHTSQRNMFTAGFNALGNPMWAIRNPGNVFSSPNTIKADLLGNVFVSGFLVNMFPMAFGTTTLNTSTGTGSYLMKYQAATGQDLWGTTLLAGAEAMALDIFGNVHLAGSFGGSVTIGSTTLSSNIQSQSEVFVAKMCNMPVLTGTNITVCAGIAGTLNVNVPPGFIPNWFSAAVGDSLLLPGSSSLIAVSSGTFYIELTDTIAGCGFTGPRVALSVSVHPSASVSVIGGSLTTNINGAVNIQWYDCLYGTIITGANSTIFNPPAPSSYAVIVSIDACVDTSDCFQFPPLGIAGHEKQESILSIFPNPNNGSFTVRSGTAGTAQLLNILGQPVKRMILEAKDNKMDLTEISEGIYFISQDGKREKFVVSK